MPHIARAVGKVEVIDQVSPIIRESADQGGSVLARNVVHDREDAPVSLRARANVDCHLVAESKKAGARQFGRESLQKYSVKIVVLHPFEMAHYRLLLESGIDLRWAAVRQRHAGGKK